VKQQQRYVRISSIASRPGHAGMLPVTAGTIWRWVKSGHFPAPVPLGPQTTAWPVEVVEDWLKQRAQGR